MTKLFKITKLFEHDYHGSEVVFVKYMLAQSEETVRIVAEARWGPPHYHKYDQGETKYNIEELEVETL
jgi:hypothetical protein